MLFLSLEEIRAKFPNVPTCDFFDEDILLIDTSGAEQRLLGLVPTEELVRFASLELTDYHSVIRQPVIFRI